MKISGFETALVDLPLATPARTSIHDIRTVACLLLTLITDEGLRGEGYVFCFGVDKLKVLEALTRSLIPELIGQDPHMVERIWADLFRRLNFFGQKGISIIVMTAIDVALWDIIGKHANLPLYKLFGGCRDRVPTYASGGLWLGSPPDALAAEAKRFVAQGFRAVKLRIGKSEIEQDIERVAAVREAIGSEIRLMVDANQAFSADHAIRLGRKLERFDLTWFEEPVPTEDFAGSAQVAAALDMPVASAETDYTSLGMQSFIAAKAADILMPDLQRMGGFTEMRKAVAVAGVHNLRVSPHLFTEHCLHVVSSAPNATYVEHMPWFGQLFKEAMTLDQDGMIMVPDRPGIGFTFDYDKIEPYRVAGAA